MSDLYLIAHKVRNEPAFDIAVRMECPECQGRGKENRRDGMACMECDATGHWWIIPTSGHRAYPCSCIPLNELRHDPDVARVLGSVVDDPLPMMEGLPDHYRVGPAPRVDIRALLRSNRPQSPPVPTIPRRFL